MIDLDEDALIACADLVGRTGARNFEIGYLDDEPGTSWYAHAQYRGARITVEGPGPIEAADALSRRLLGGAQCMCGKPVSLSSGGTGCRWTRQGRTWVGACGRGRR